ncbi:G-D-S-L family lipolytic protein [Pseudodesulfovibrio sp. JC047]|uniref:GDSL-type esterase/lipase family protein n=1 Tax=Pseudodesulfovibrio sp. JC047 TaxID=2683199 RepID=UPI0013D033C3|nr:GDSL-type esterase/lipase family protein [Pseudodesulfovibrio sp. JC047]NDV20741.1 G-D-S-L family lipolytic protein [Pseudodesulfovibrio sp. JC047]
MILCFLGDSLTLGYGDETTLGWPGRITQILKKTGKDVTSYNLGIRKNASICLEQQWLSEVQTRILTDVPLKLVFSFGVADVMNDIALEDTLQAADSVFKTAQKLGEVLFIGPTPVLNSEINGHIKTIGTAISTRCTQMDIPCVLPFDSMECSAVYEQALSNGDSVHPTADGYAAIAKHIIHNNVARTFFGLE